ncbi:uncharacterized protein LOC115211843 isoform X1 [Argonauta hians]
MGHVLWTCWVFTTVILMAGAVFKNVDLCGDILACHNSQLIRIDYISNSNSTKYLELLRSECNGQQNCTLPHVRCEEYKHQNHRYRIRYSCIKSFSRNICSDYKQFNSEPRNLFSQQYPLDADNNRILCRFKFNTSLRADLILHDSGSDIFKVRVDVYYQKKTRWINYQTKAIYRIIHLPKSASFDIYFHSSRIWFSFQRNNGREPQNEAQLNPVPDSEKQETNGHPPNQPPPPPPLPPPKGGNTCLGCESSTPQQNVKSSTPQTIAVAVVMGLILVIITGLIMRRYYQSKHTHIQSRPTAAISQPDISSIYVSPDTFTSCVENEDNHIYERITTSIYCDPQITVERNFTSENNLNPNPYCEPLKFNKSESNLKSNPYCQPAKFNKSENNLDLNPYCEPLKYNQSENNLNANHYCKPQTVLKSINSDSRVNTTLYSEPLKTNNTTSLGHEAEDLKKGKDLVNTPIYVNIL